jgi:hypothetical protein
MTDGTGVWGSPVPNESPWLNVRHFHEKLREEHELQLSYTWGKKALQGAGLVRAERKRGVHRRRRERRPLQGMLLHIDGSHHHWFQDDRWYDRLVILDDATSRIYYAQLVEEESTVTVLRALRKVVEQEGIFCALYNDRTGHLDLSEPMMRDAGLTVEKDVSADLRLAMADPVAVGKCMENRAGSAQIVCAAPGRNCGALAAVRVPASEDP